MNVTADWFNLLFIMGQPALSETELFQTEMSVGEIFRRTRVHYGQSLTDIERSLRIRACQIEAIENDQIEKLPGRVYAIGFIRSYAEYLGLNGDKMVHLFKVQLGGKAPVPELHFPVSASESKLPPWWLVALSLALVFIVMIGWLSLSGRDQPVVNEVPPVPEDLKSSLPSSSVFKEGGGTESAALPAEGAAPVEAPVPEEPIQKGIILSVKENSWVEITDESGKALVSRVLKQGENYYVPDRPDLKMSLGNAGGLEVQLNGEILSPLGDKGEVKRNIPLDIEYLEAHYLPTQAADSQP